MYRQDPGRRYPETTFLSVQSHFLVVFFSIIPYYSSVLERSASILSGFMNRNISFFPMRANPMFTRGGNIIHKNATCGVGPRMRSSRVPWLLCLIPPQGLLPILRLGTLHLVSSGDQEIFYKNLIFILSD